MSRIKKLLRASERVWIAQRAHHTAIVENVPIGSVISYTHKGGARQIVATVTGHSRDQVRVVGVTGREYWLCASRIKSIDDPTPETRP